MFRWLRLCPCPPCVMISWVQGGDREGRREVEFYDGGWRCKERNRINTIVEFPVEDASVVSSKVAKKA